MSDRREVPLVRVPREEQYFEREAVLGRDATSVFPTEAKAAAAAAGAGLAELLGANNKFISETELEEIKASRGLRAEDGTIAADKPLAEVLREAKEAKEAAFADKWKQMKQGKNRPLDDDEFEFVDSVAAQEAAAARARRDEESAALAAFHAAQAAAAGGAGAGTGVDDAAAEQQQQPGAGAVPVAGAQQGKEAAAKKAAAPKKQPLLAVKPLIRTVVRPKSREGDAAGAGSGGGGGGPAPKRQRTGSGGGGEDGGSSGSEGPGLAGLLGGYGSGSESDA